ncbi:acyl-CoA thioesterase [Fictibacillus sp. NRS-1165]|uniref:acyl-CoA thioesterase n=1 Tax=Fictibacillus sp. NRS-1165 TaxID=3144463 RepID=UPI003D259B3D
MKVTVTHLLAPLHQQNIASISSMRHSRRNTVTASTDSVDFLHPINEASAVCLEAFVTYTGRTSIKVFVKVSPKIY